MEIVPDPQMISRTSSDRVSPFWLAQNPGQKPSSHQILPHLAHALLSKPLPQPCPNPLQRFTDVLQWPGLPTSTQAHLCSLHPAVRVRGHLNLSMPRLCSEPSGAPHYLKVKFQRISRP